MIVALLALGTLSVLKNDFGIDPFDRGGWSTESGIRYLDYSGDPVAGWQNIDGKWYYFDSRNDNIMVTGWLEQGEERYYLGSDGARITGWTELGGSSYHFNILSGSADTGWFRDTQGSYYLDPDTGAMQTGWVQVDGSRYYLDTATGLLHTGWLEMDGQVYYLDGTTGALAMGWVTVDDSTYYLDETSGTLYTGWLENDEGRRYLDQSTGAMTVGWLETEEGPIYFDEKGLLRTGWTEAAEGSYYLDADGHPVTGWLDWEGERYYLDETGLAACGWLELDGVTYYFQEDGTMAIGKVFIGESACYFSSTGAYVMLVNAWNALPEGYEPELVEFEGWQVSAECYDALAKMLSDCPYSYIISSTYRSLADQDSIRLGRYYKYGNMGYGPEAAWAMVDKYVAKSGYSEHHLGTAIDVSGSDYVCQWLAEHCWEYGFVLRYPEGKSDVTGITYERWHFRYLGTELAAELTELDLTLEEYMDMLTARQGSDAGTASDPEIYNNCYSQS